MLRPLHTSILTCLVAFALLIAGAEASLAPQDEGAPPPPQEEADDPPPLSVEDQEIAEEAGEAEEREIVSESAALEARLRSILDATDLFDGIEVASTRAGIVVLDGMATSRTAADAAVELAGDIDGVLLVVDEIEVDVRLLSRVKNSWRSASERFVSGLAALPLVAIALLIVGFGYVAGRLLAAATPIYALITERVLVQNLLRQSVLAFAVIASIFAALRFLEATALLGTVLGAAGVVGIAFGFAFRDVVENYLSGILLAIRRPFFAKDFIEVDGTMGTVVTLTASETTLLDPDGNHVRIPNATVFKNRVKNFTRNPLRRLKVEVGVGTDVDLLEATRIGVETLEGIFGILDDPEPSGFVKRMGDSNVELQLYAWIDQSHTSYMKASSEATRLVKAAFDREGISMPSPTYELHVHRGPAESLGPVAAPAPAVTLKQLDTSSGDDVDEQVEQQIAETGGEDLLSKDDGPPKV